MPRDLPPSSSLDVQRVFAALLIGLAALGAGCGEQASIARYAVPKEPDTPVAPALQDAPASNPTAWFFKLEGPQETVGEVESQFVGLVESIRFEGGKPRWTLPEGWTETGGSQMRFATLNITSTAPPLEVSVIPLPVFGNDDSEYLRQNIDRWRGQLGLAPSADADWLSTAKTAGEVRESSAGGVPVTFVDLRGKTEKYDPARMLGAVLLPGSDEVAALQRTPTEGTPRLPPVATDSSPLTFNTPDGWGPGKSSTMRAASFLVADGASQLDISAMTAGGDELGNVNRWRGQVGLEPISDDEVNEIVRKLEVDGTTGRMFEIVGPHQTILAAIVANGGQTWFFKLMGDPALAEREKANFEAWVTSVKFR